MNLSKMKILTLSFVLVNVLLFLSLYRSHVHVSLLIMSISAAMVFFALAVMQILVRVHKRFIGQLRQPMHVGSVAFALTGVTGATQSMSLGISTGAWEYWALMTNFIYFVFGVLILWFNKFVEKLLQDVQERK